MGFLSDMLNRLEGIKAQVQMRDGGQTYNTVRNRKKLPPPITKEAAPPVSVVTIPNLNKYQARPKPRVNQYGQPTNVYPGLSRQARDLIRY